MITHSNTNTLELNLELNYYFKYNEINNKLYFKSKFDEEMEFKEVKEYELNSILRTLKGFGETKLSKKELAEILNSNFTPTFNPFIDYFHSLPQWEGNHDYIQELANTITVDPEEQSNWHEWFKKWIVAVVACAIDENVTNQQMLILQGRQSVGKSTWLEKLRPKPLKNYYYSGSINLGNKDTEIQLSENLFINLDELENFTRRNVLALKEIITKPAIKLRRPYGTAAENMPRRASFMGSVNSPEFLNDPTGNRRYLCFETKAIADHCLDMDNVYSQAIALYKSNFPYWISKEDTDKIENHNRKYVYVTMEQEILENHFSPCKGTEEPDYELETEAFLELIYDKSKIAQRLSVHKLGAVLKSLNWSKRKTKGRRYWLIKDTK